jgi:predicted porin
LWGCDSINRYREFIALLRGADRSVAAHARRSVRRCRRYRIAPYFWFGAKYAINSQLDVTGAFYYLSQNDYSTSLCTGTGIHTSSGSCSGSEDFLSFLIDYRPVKRVDLYAGVMLSNVYGGLASGYQQVQTINPTAGLRVKF